MTMELIFDVGAIIIADLILSGDNALIIGMAAAGLSPGLRAKAILFGMVIAALLRVVFAVIATTLLGIPGLLFVGGLLLCWVCWRLYSEIRGSVDAKAELVLETAGDPHAGYTGAPRRSLASALWTITLADVSMSLDNVLAVAGVARDHTWVLVVGLVLSVAFMGLAAAWIARQLEHRPWIAYVGLVVIFYVAATMIFEGAHEIAEVAATS